MCTEERKPSPWEGEMGFAWMPLFGVNLLQYLHLAESVWLPYFFSFPWRLSPFPSCFILAHFPSETASVCWRNSGECLDRGIPLFLAFAIELNLGSLQHRAPGWRPLPQTQIYCREIGISLFSRPLIYWLPHLLQALAPPTYPPCLTLLQRLSGLLFLFYCFPFKFCP